MAALRCRLFGHDWHTNWHKNTGWPPAPIERMLCDRCHAIRHLTPLEREIEGYSCERGKALAQWFAQYGAKD